LTAGYVCVVGGPSGDIQLMTSYADSFDKFGMDALEPLDMLHN
jgi:hypothetical protein